MLPKRVCLAVGCLAIIASGCSASRPARCYARSWATEPLPITINGEPVAPTRGNVLRGIEPTYVIQTPEGEVCIWRDTVFRAFEDLPGHSDLIISFDRDGHFRPTDPDAYYGFCSHCGEDLRMVVENRCPACGQEFTRP